MFGIPLEPLLEGALLPGTIFAVALLGAAALSLALTPLVRRLAVARGVLDQPDPRKVHVGAVPRWGGVAVGCAAALGVAMVLLLNPDLRRILFSGSGAARWAALAIGSLVILIAGMVDDARGLPAWFKLGLECAAAALVVLAAPYPHAIALGPSTTAHELGALGAVFAVLWIVTLTNAVNMTDVVDGVAGGLGAIAALALGLVSIALGRVVASVVLLGLAGALLGFLPHNFRKQRIFLGDSGSLVVGFLLGAASLVGLTSDVGVWLLLPAVLALGMPLAECSITVLRRTMRAMTIERVTTPEERFVLHQGPPRLFTPDARHIPHRLLRLGLSQRGALAVLYGGAALLGGLAYVSVRWPWIGLWGGVAAVLVLGYAATRWWYKELRLLDRGALLPLFDNPFVHRRGTHVAYDVAAATLAFLVSTALLAPAHVASPLALARVALVVGATLIGLWIGDIYRAAYLNAGLAEALRATRAALGGAVLAWVAWRVLFGAPWPVAGWLLYVYVLLTLVVGGRFLSRLLLYAHERATSGTRRALIFGAGRAGRQALGAMLANPALGFIPLGFVDDNERLWQAEVHGYPVHGGTEQLDETLARLRVDDLVMSAPGAAPERRAEIAALCGRRGVRMVAFDVQWQTVDTGAPLGTPAVAGQSGGAA